MARRAALTCSKQLLSTSRLWRPADLAPLEQPPFAGPALIGRRPNREGASRETLKSAKVPRCSSSSHYSNQVLRSCKIFHIYETDTYR